MSEDKLDRPVPIGFSNTIVYDRRNVLFQLRTPDNGGKIVYDGHLGTWGGKHDLDSPAGTSPKKQAIRELREELNLEGDLSRRLQNAGVYLMPLSESCTDDKRCLPGSHNVEALVSEGYIGWVNWMYKLKVDDVSALQVREGSAIAIPHRQVEQGKFPHPVMSDYGMITAKAIFRNKLSLPFDNLPKLIESDRRIDFSAFDIYLNCSSSPENNGSNKG